MCDLLQNVLNILFDKQLFMIFCRVWKLLQRNRAHNIKQSSLLIETLERMDINKRPEIGSRKHDSKDVRERRTRKRRTRKIRTRKSKTRKRCKEKHASARGRQESKELIYLKNPVFSCTHSTRFLVFHSASKDQSFREFIARLIWLVSSHQKKKVHWLLVEVCDQV